MKVSCLFTIYTKHRGTPGLFSTGIGRSQFRPIIAVACIPRGKEHTNAEERGSEQTLTDVQARVTLELPEQRSRREGKGLKAVRGKGDRERPLEAWE